MGFEYKLITTFTIEQTDHLILFLEAHINHYKSYYFNNFKYLEFRTPDNGDVMPNITIVLEADGLYICQHGSSHLWQDIEELEEYLKIEDTKYTIVDYQE